MKKIAILGCENSHANLFLDYIIKDKKYPDIEVVGVYSDDIEAANKLNEAYGVYAAKSYDEFAGKIDGVIITARHGDNHYKYAKPYLKYGIPMFIDKPVTCTEEDARDLYNELVKNNTPICGGTVCAHSDSVKELKKTVKEKSEGEVHGGCVSSIVSLDNPYGNFFFYAQHTVEVMCEIFGYYPHSVKAYKNGGRINCTVRYDEYDVNLLFIDGENVYAASAYCGEKVLGGAYSLDGLFEKEFAGFNKLLNDKKSPKSYEDFVAPVFVANAISRSVESGKEEKVNRL